MTTTLWNGGLTGSGHVPYVLSTPFNSPAQVTALNALSCGSLCEQAVSSHALLFRSPVAAHSRAHFSIWIQQDIET